MEVRIFLKNGFRPTKATSGSAGFDIYCPQNTELPPGQIVLVSTGIYLHFPSSYECQIRSRSSMAMRGIIIPNSPGTIDSDYRDEVKILMLNLNEEPVNLEIGNKIAQMVFCRIPNVDIRFPNDWDLFNKGPKSGRKGGFGSTGS